MLEFVCDGTCIQGDVMRDVAVAASHASVPGGMRCAVDREDVVRDWFLIAKRKPMDERAHFATVWRHSPLDLGSALTTFDLKASDASGDIRLLSHKNKSYSLAEGMAWVLGRRRRTGNAHNDGASHPHLRPERLHQRCH